MKSLILISVLLIGCNPTPRPKWQIICDSGFKSPVSYSTYIDDGVIEYREYETSTRNHRKMIEGEICTDNKIKQHAQ